MDGVPDDDERLVRFARLIAHGMRNPLAIATGMLDLLDRQVGDDLDGELRDLLRRSSEAIRRAGDQLLMLQRYTAAAREELLVDELDLAEVVE
ncbi:MAG: histidine kinase dimerization/phospho-acceptor domain-containing protein, partial [Acidimicrobiia bacterium]